MNNRKPEWIAVGREIHKVAGLLAVTVGPDAKANARLIAAAPELFNALRDALAHLQGAPDCPWHLIWSLESALFNADENWQFAAQLKDVHFQTSTRPC